MSKYTISIKDIIYANKGDDDPTTLAGIHDIAERTLFGAELNVLNPEIVDRFITGFTLHYFNDEIGYETFPMWRIALQEKIWNNSELIDGIYANLDKQVFTDYKVHTSNRTHGKVDSITTNLNSDTKSADSSVGSNTKTGTSSDAHTGTQDLDRTSAGATVRGGADSEHLTGDDTTTRTGTTSTARTAQGSDQRTGTDTTDRVSADSMTKGGTVSTERDYGSTQQGQNASATNGGDYITESSGNTRSESGSYKDKMVGSSYGSTDDNSVNVQFDTPMGSIGNMRSSGTAPSKGDGVAAASNGAFNYMSAAQENDGSRAEVGSESSETTRSFDNYQVEDQASRTLDGTASHIATSGSSSQATTGNDDNTTTYNTVDNASRSGKDTTQYNSGTTSKSSGTDVRTDDLQDQVSHDTTREMTYGGKENVSGSEKATNTFDDTMTHTDNLRDDSVRNNSGSVNVDSTTATTEQHNETETSDSRDYAFNYEMFMKADIMMNKMWQIFDPIFFSILDAF